MRLAIFGLALSSSWGNGHATTYRGLLRGLRALGHDTDFFERDVDWYARHRDLPQPDDARLHLYADWESARGAALAAALAADAVLVGSYFPDAVPALDELLERRGATRRPVLAFYDIDTPITLDALRRDQCAYLRADQIPALDLYLSFTGGPVLEELARRWRARLVRPLYCACDPGPYRAARRPSRPHGTLGFLGTYAPDRANKLRRLLLEPAQRLPRAQFEVAGSMYPDAAAWPANVQHIHHLPPGQHPAFYARSRFTLNLTRQAMVEAGYSPSVRLFEAAAAATPIVTDPWPGLELFFEPGRDILVARDTAEMITLLQQVGDAEAAALGRAAQERTLAAHTGLHRARELVAALEAAASPVHPSAK